MTIEGYRHSWKVDIWRDGKLVHALDFTGTGAEFHREIEHLAFEVEDIVYSEDRDDE